MPKPLVSIIIRTLNEEKFLEELLNSIALQSTDVFDIETVIVDSGSTDRTLHIAENHFCRITKINKNEFTFGRSLNVGCDFAMEVLRFRQRALRTTELRLDYKLVEPLVNGCAYTYGRQLARDTTKFSENQLFEKYFPAESRVPQVGFL